MPGPEPARRQRMARPEVVRRPSAARRPAACVARYRRWNASTPRRCSTSSASGRGCASRSSTSTTTTIRPLLADRTSDLTEGWPEPDTDVVLLGADSIEAARAARGAGGADPAERRDLGRLAQGQGGHAARRRGHRRGQGGRARRQQGRLVLGDAHRAAARDPRRAPAALSVAPDRAVVLGAPVTDSAPLRGIRPSHRARHARRRPACRRQTIRRPRWPQRAPPVDRPHRPTPRSRHPDARRPLFRRRQRPACPCPSLRRGDNRRRMAGHEWTSGNVGPHHGDACGALR